MRAQRCYILGKYTTITMQPTNRWQGGRKMATNFSLPKNWNKEADVVVIGYGAAGATTAITAHDAGAKVLILEKAPEGEEGGVAGQAWLSPVPVDRSIHCISQCALRCLYCSVRNGPNLGRGDG